MVVGHASRELAIPDDKFFIVVGHASRELAIPDDKFLWFFNGSWFCSRGLDNFTVFLAIPMILT
jgi:hypothetical protein